MKITYLGQEEKVCFLLKYYKNTKAIKLID